MQSTHVLSVSDFSYVGTVYNNKFLQKLSTFSAFDFSCKTRWQKEHDSMSCDEFKEWKAKQDAEEVQSIYSVLGRLK